MRLIVKMLLSIGMLLPVTLPGMATEAVTLRLKWFNQAQFAGFYVAKDKGYYNAAGLDVNIQPGGPDFPAIQMVAGGNEQFGVTGADQILIARSKGVPVVALARDLPRESVRAVLAEEVRHQGACRVQRQECRRSRSAATRS